MTDTVETLEKEIARLKRYEDLVRSIAGGYIELSHHKVQNEYLHLIGRCRKLVLEDWVEPDYEDKPVKDDL